MSIVLKKSEDLMTEQNTITSQDEKIKIWWLAFLCSVTFLNIFVALIETLAINSVKDLSSLNTSFDTVFTILFISIFFILSAYVRYHCAYKKNGIKLLTLNLILLPILAIPEAFETGFDLTSFVVVLFSIIWWVLCFKLRKINMKIRASYQAVTA